jgi:hypothetical protein
MEVIGIEQCSCEGKACLHKELLEAVSLAARPSTERNGGA